MYKNGVVEHFSGKWLIQINWDIYLSYYKINIETKRDARLTHIFALS